MNRKIKWAIAIVMLLVATIFFITTVFQREYRDILMEVIIFPEGVSGGGAPVYRFIVQNTGTFITYTGISRNHCDEAKSNIIMWPVIRRRARVTLSDDDFQDISERVTLVSETSNTTMTVFGLWQITLLYDGSVYHGGLELHKLADELVRLSPLISHQNYPRIPPDFLDSIR